MSIDSFKGMENTTLLTSHTELLSAIPCEELLEISKKAIENNHLELSRKLALVGIETYPRVPSFYYQLAESYMREGNWLNAMHYWKCVDTSFTRKPPGFYIQYARCCLKEGFYEKSKEIILTGLRVFKNHSGLLSMIHIIESHTAEKIEIKIKNNSEIFSISTNSKQLNRSACKLTFQLQSFCESIEKFCFLISGHIFYVKDNNELTSNIDNAKECVLGNKNEVSLDNELKFLEKIGYIDSSGNIVWTCEISLDRIDNVLVGLKNWLFLCNDTNDSVGLATGKKKLSLINEAQWRTFFSKIESLEFKRLAVLVSCSKESIRSEFYPYQITSCTVLNGVESVSKDYNIRFVNPLRELKDNIRSYFETDTHWSDEGAVIALESVFKSLNIESLEPAPTYLMSVVSGDLGSKMEPVQTSNRATFDDSLFNKEKIKNVFNNQINGTGNITIIENSVAPRLETVVLFGGSSSNMLREILKYYYSRVVYVNLPGGVVESIIKYEDPSFVICQTNERYMLKPGQILTDLKDMPLLKGFSHINADKIPPLVKYFRKSKESFYSSVMSKYLDKSQF